MRPHAFSLLAVAALALGGCDAPTTPLDAHDLQLAARQVTSYAGEGEWLAQQLGAGSISANMAWVHERALGEDAAKVTRDLSTRPVPPALQPAHEKLLQLDARLQTAVTRIAGAASRSDELGALRREFHAIASEARPMGGPT